MGTRRETRRQRHTKQAITRNVRYLVPQLQAPQAMIFRHISTVKNTAKTTSATFRMYTKEESASKPGLSIASRIQLMTMAINTSHSKYLFFVNAKQKRRSGDDGSST